MPISRRACPQPGVGLPFGVLRRGRYMESRSVAIPGARLEFCLGLGRAGPICPDRAHRAELRLDLTDPALDGYRKILYHRRGYTGSSPDDGQASIVRDATDCANLLTELAVDRAHVVGLSYSGAVALQLAAGAPERAHTLTLLEPPPVHTPSAVAFRAATEELIATRREIGLQPRSTSS